MAQAKRGSDETAKPAKVKVRMDGRTGDTILALHGTVQNLVQGCTTAFDTLLEYVVKYCI